MERKIAYRGQGGLSLKRLSPVDEEVEIELLPGVRIEWSGYGQLLVYRDRLPYGYSLTAALELGWCREVT
jgi:hypothetical protein